MSWTGWNRDLGPARMSRNSSICGPEVTSVIRPPSNRSSSSAGGALGRESSDTITFVAKTTRIRLPRRSEGTDLLEILVYEVGNLPGIRSCIGPPGLADRLRQEPLPDGVVHERG